IYSHTKPRSRRVSAHLINARCNRTGFRQSNACSDADLTEIETENRIHGSAYSLSGWQLSTSLQEGVPPYESKPTPAQFLKSRNRRAVGPCKNSCPGGRSLA